MTSYDYGSVMHYEADAFTRNGLPTIVPTKNASAVIGQRFGMSPIDILEVQRYYGCVATATTNISTTTSPSTTTTTSRSLIVLPKIAPVFLFICIVLVNHLSIRT